jgi:hypothetical protein
MIEVGTVVYNKGRGDWKRGTVVAKVPAGSNGRRTAMGLGLPGAAALTDTPARPEASWLVRITDRGGQQRLRWPMVTGIVEAGTAEAEGLEG